MTKNPQTGHAKDLELPNLDLLRSIAVLFVLYDHIFTRIVSGSHDLVPWLGRLGVLFFFVHTCCVLMMSLERHEGPHLIMKFYARRTFRIYPLIIVAVLIAFFSPGPRLKIWELISNLALIQNLTFARYSFGSIWSLPIEVQMYLVLPFAFLIVSRFTRPWVPFALLCLSFPVAYCQPHHVARASVLFYSPNFLPGVIAYQIFKAKYQRFPSWAFVPLIGITTAIFLYRPGWQASAWLTCLLLGVALPLVRQIQSATVRVVSSLIAKYSYGIYIAHSVLTLYMRPSSQNLPWYLLATGIGAVLSYHLLEHPMIRFGYHVTRQRKIQAPVLVSQRQAAVS